MIRQYFISLTLTSLEKVRFSEPARRLAGGSVISTRGRNLVFIPTCRDYIGKISRFALRGVGPNGAEA